jgi:hypothetical protein
MADKNISQLTATTTPLAGSEVWPMVQSGGSGESGYIMVIWIA